MSSLQERMMAFGTKVAVYGSKHPQPMLDEFVDYWTEHNDGGKKMRFEMSKNQPFNIGRRLGTWKKNNRSWGTKNAPVSQEVITKLGKYD